MARNALVEYFSSAGVPRRSSQLDISPRHLPLTSPPRHLLLDISCWKSGHLLLDISCWTSPAGHLLLEISSGHLLLDISPGHLPRHLLDIYPRHLAWTSPLLSPLWHLPWKCPPGHLPCVIFQHTYAECYIDDTVFHAHHVQARSFVIYM